MNTRTVEPRPSAVSSPSREPRTEASASELVEAPTSEHQRTLQRMADGSPRVARTTTVQRQADDSPRVSALRDMQNLATRASSAPLQAKLGGEARPAGGESLGTRRGLPGSLRGKMERSFGVGFGDVTIRTNSSKAGARGALAVTQGSEIDFAPGQFRPDSSAGQALIGHELTHVLQQRAGRVSQAQSKARRSPLEQQLDVDHDDACEREADELGARAARGEQVRVGGAPSDPRPAASAGPIQPKLGFELEMLVLIDKAGRPLPEKTEVGEFGEHIHLDVDHGPKVAAITPMLPEETDFDIPTDKHEGWYHYEWKYEEGDTIKSDYLEFETFNDALGNPELWVHIAKEKLAPQIAPFMEDIRRIERNEIDYDAHAA
ncbi:MAG: DUF4157 domain-containing protein, partial [Myxococcales bacterium]|nr:DUF4157 domain-containing protein [Myxococcales bacterium]